MCTVVDNNIPNDLKSKFLKKKKKNTRTFNISPECLHCMVDGPRMKSTVLLKQCKHKIMQFMFLLLASLLELFAVVAVVVNDVVLLMVVVQHYHFEFPRPRTNMQ